MSEENQETQEPQQQPQTQTRAIEISSGVMNPKDHKELSMMIGYIAKGGGFPDRFDTPEKRLAAYNLARTLIGDRWQIAVNHMAFIKGQLQIYGELPAALAESSREVQERDVYLVDQDLNRICIKNKNISAAPYAGVCDIQRRGRSLKQFTYTIEQARDAGQYPPKRRDGSVNEDSPWMKFTGIMLMRKAQAIAVKMEFPDAIGGVPVCEYDHDLAPDLKDVTPLTSDNASVLNGVFKEATDNAGAIQ